MAVQQRVKRINRRWRVETTVQLRNGSTHTMLCQNWPTQGEALEVAHEYLSGGPKSVRLIGENHDAATRTDRWFLGVDGKTSNPITLSVYQI